MNLSVIIGWIYAVYSPVDSVAFSGNFLHSFAIGDQLSVYKLEQRLKVGIVLLSVWSLFTMTTVMSLTVITIIPLQCYMPL